jgi:hypothetical protein
MYQEYQRHFVCGTEMTECSLMEPSNLGPRVGIISKRHPNLAGQRRTARSLVLPLGSARRAKSAVNPLNSTFG